MSIIKRLEKIERVILSKKVAIPPGEELLAIFPDEGEDQATEEKKERFIQGRLDDLNRNYGPGVSRGDLVIFEVVYDSPKADERQ